VAAGADDAATAIANLRQEIKSLPDAAARDTQAALDYFSRRLRLERSIGNALDDVVSGPRGGVDPTAGATVEKLVNTQFEAIEAAIGLIHQRMDELRRERSDAAAEDLLEFEYPLRDYGELASGFLREAVDNAGRAERLKLDKTKSLAALDEILRTRAQEQTERIETTRKQIGAARERLALVAEDQRGDINNELAALEQRRQRIKRDLEATIDMLRERGVDVSTYVQALVKATGEISGDVLDSKVLRGLFDDWTDITRETIARNGPAWLFKIILFVVIVIAAKLLARLARVITRRAISVSRMEFSSLLQEFFVKLASNIVLGIGLLIALAQLGVHLGPVLAGLGVAGLVIGFALQDTLSNFASGLMILIYRPYDIDDVVEAGGVSGKVKQMSLVSTTILTFDNQKLVVPNNKIWGDVIRNVNAAPTRRVDMTFGIGYGDDIAAAETVLRDIIADHELVLDDPEPTIKLHTLGESSLDFIVRPWVKAADYWTVYWDVTRAVKERFDAAGISIPYPQRDVHLYQEKVD